MDQMGTLFHADKAKTTFFPCFFHVEACALVHYEKLNRIGVFVEIHRKPAYPAVLDCVMQSFLGDAKKGQRDILWQILPYVLSCELNDYVILP